MDKLLNHYKLFINIGKNIERIETHLTHTECINKNYLQKMIYPANIKLKKLKKFFFLIL